MAPSMFLPSYDKSTEISGTSVSAPLVSRGLALVFNFIDYLTTEEAKILLKKTAFFSINQAINIENRNHGIFNVVRLIEYSRYLQFSGFNKLSKNERLKNTK